MNAGTRHITDIDPAYLSMNRAFGVSVALHVIIALVATIGLPFIKTDPPIIDTPIAVELVTIADITQTNRLAAPQEKPKEIETPKPPAEKPPAPPKQTSEAPPDLSQPKPPEPIKEKPKEKPPEPVPPPEKAKKDPPKEKPKPKPKESTKPQPKEDQFASLLKNLTPDASESAKTDPKEKTEDTDNASGAIAPLADQLTMSELDALKYQIAQCWNVPTGAKYAENLSVEIRITLNRDGSLQNANVVDRGRYNRDSAFRAAADSALRALRNPRCSPLKLPPQKYDRWKHTVMNFDPRDML